MKWISHLHYAMTSKSFSHTPPFSVVGVLRVPYLVFRMHPLRPRPLKYVLPTKAIADAMESKEWKKLHLVCMTTCAFMVVHVNKFMWQSLYIHSTLSNTLSLLGKKRVLSHHKMQFEYASNRAFNTPYGMILEMALFLHVINKNSGGKNTIPLNY